MPAGTYYSLAGFQTTNPYPLTGSSGFQWTEMEVYQLSKEVVIVKSIGELKSQNSSSFVLHHAARVHANSHSFECGGVENSFVR